MESPFLIEVFDKGFARQGVIAVPVSASFTVRFNALSVATVVLADDDPNQGILDPDANPGARIRCTYLGEHLFSGPVTRVRGTVGPGGRTYEFEDDWRLLLNSLAWVVPSGHIAPANLDDEAQSYLAGAGTTGVAEGSPFYHFTATTAEGAIKELVTANLVTRLGLPITVAPDLGRGGDAAAAGMLPQVRFTSVSEAIQGLLDWSGLGLRVWHDGSSSTLTVDVWEPAEYVQALTPEAGIVVGGEWSVTAPTVTRAIVGGPGDDVSRAFWSVTDATGAEASLGYALEAFVDGGGAPMNWPDTLADPYKAAKYYLQRSEVSAEDKDAFTTFLNVAGQKAVSDGTVKSSVSARLSETDAFHFGGPTGVQLGDVVSIVVSGVTFTDRVQDCDLQFDGSAGLVVTPQVGERRDDPDWALAEAIARLAAAQRRLSSRK